MEDDKSVLKVLLETITCAMTRDTLMQFLNLFISILGLPLKIAHKDELEMVEAILAHIFVRNGAFTIIDFCTEFERNISRSYSLKFSLHLPYFRVFTKLAHIWLELVICTR